MGAMYAGWMVKSGWGISQEVLIILKISIYAFGRELPFCE